MIYFIVNEASRTGKAKRMWEDLQSALLRSSVPYRVYKTKGKGHATEIASQICDFDDDNIAIVVFGGDGTVNETINGISNFNKIRFGIIPTGSGNDFGKGLGLPSSASENLSLIIDSYKAGVDNYKSIDIGEAIWASGRKSRLFAISSGIGLDAYVCDKTNKSKLKKLLNKLHLGSLSYSLLTVKTLFTMKYYDTKIVLSNIVDGKYNEKTVVLKKNIFSAVMNMPAEGGGVKMAPKANPYDGLFHLTSASNVPKWLTFLCLPILLAAKHEKLKKVFSIYSAKSIHIKLSKPMTLHTDGECFYNVTDVKYICHNNKLKLLNNL